MYTKVKSALLLVALMKEYGIKYCVLSPGTCALPITHSLEVDKDFICYSIVDERNAAYFALGLAQQTQEGVAICCTSGTAAANYFPAINEAFFQHVPLLVITSDRNPYYEFQLADQKIPQHNMYQNVVNKSVTLPIIKDEKDEWYCERCIIEALLEMKHNEPGPVHINIPIELGEEVDFTTINLPEVRKIQRISLGKRKDSQKIQKLIYSLKGKRIMLIFGQDVPCSEKEKRDIEQFADNYNCVIVSEPISNLICKWGINTYLLSMALNKESFRGLEPDIVITFGGQYLSSIRNFLQICEKPFEHWCVNADGRVIDHLKRQTCIIEADKNEFFSMLSSEEIVQCSHEFYEEFKKRTELIPEPDFQFSNNYVIEKIVKNLPDNSIVHLGIDSIVRLVSCLSVNPLVTVYSNRGTTGIDGAVSTFMGQSENHDGLSFLLVGDLSFFYNMNGIFGKRPKRNIRILLSNNGGGETFYWGDAKNIENKDPFIGASHNISARGWVESLGFHYIAIHNKIEFEENLELFVSPHSELPIFMEAFTDKNKDAEEMLKYFQQCRWAVNRWQEKLKPGEKCCIFGIGNQALYVTECVKKLGGEIVCYCDSAKEKEGSFFLEKPVIHTLQLKEKRGFLDKIIISSEKYYEGMREMLEQLGFSEADYFLIS